MQHVDGHSGKLNEITAHVCEWSLFRFTCDDRAEFLGNLNFHGYHTALQDEGKAFLSSKKTITRM
jgi:hypothetical protein